MTKKLSENDKTRNGNSTSALVTQIEVNDITYGYSPHKPVLEDVTVKIPKGRFVGLVGDNYWLT